MGRRALAGAALAAAGMLGLSGCGFSGLYNIPLPGGANLGGHPYTVTADFSDALDLVPQSAVRVNDVPVGRVDSINITPDGRTAEVKLKINGSVRLPANATAAVEQTTLLGEKYVQLSAPSGGVAPEGTLANGAVISEDKTSAGIQVEDVFGALSLLLNGGGLGQLQSIDDELNKAQAGHTAEFRSLFTSLDSVVGQLNAHRTDITTALDQLDTLSATLASNDNKIDNVLQNLSPGLQVLANERTQFTAMLTSLQRLSTVSVSTIHASQAEFIEDLTLLKPILDQLTAAGQALPDSLQVLFTYPFPDAAVGAIKGDYLNAFITLNLHSSQADADTPPMTRQPGLTQSQVTAAQHAAPTTAAGPSSRSAPPTLLPSSTTISISASGSPLGTSSSGSPTPSGTGSPSGAPSSSSSSSSPGDSVTPSSSEGGR